MKTLDDLRRETDVPVVMADGNGIITYVNQIFETVFGWQAHDLIGKLLSTIIPPSLHDAHHLGFSRFLITGKPTLLNQPLKLKAIKKNGQEFDAEHFIVAEERDGQWVFGATIQPIS